VQARANAGASAWFATDDDPKGKVGKKVSRFEIFYQRHPRGGTLNYRVDDGEWRSIDTRATSVQDAVERIDVVDGSHALTIRTSGSGEVRIYGVVLERDGPGVVYDSLGIVGARASRMLGFDREHLRQQLNFRGTHLVVLGFGGNDADDQRSEEEFYNTFRSVARLIREVRPQAACLLFAPLDQGKRDERGRIITLPSVPKIVNASRRAAESEGCAFFNTFAAMGGEGAMGRWFKQHPRLASGDFRHATPAGYRLIGELFHQAIIDGFRRYVERGGGKSQ
ncbi:MAG: GDSL-type esterase/lipase family protein, partial [Deltaproteobacteria bacterium]|nr:GDSL-type esterase/lipase family protein [Deltaproteobacteria bacterium]